MGGEKEIAVDVRIVAATNKDLFKEIEQNNFRMDLYHRLSVIIIHVPSLNERRDDIPEIAQSFLEEICGEYGIPMKKFEATALEALKQINWTGNIRELHNMIERLIILSDKTITKEDVYLNANRSTNHMHTNVELVEHSNADYSKYKSFQEFKDETEKEYILSKLEKNGWNVSKTADEMEIQRSHLYNKIEKYGLKRDA